MTFTKQALRVKLAPGDFFPQAFRWQGRFYRVLAVHGVWTCGIERRYRVATAEGYFEIALQVPHDAWYVRRAPNLLSRAWYRLQNGARYPLPFWRRRANAVRAARQSTKAAEGYRPSSGGQYADRSVVV